MNVEQLTKIFCASVEWQACGSGWQADIDGQRCFLDENSNPGEHEFTLTISGEPIQFDGLPEKWAVPFALAA